MKDQVKLIKNRDWDVLCVLDSCRFDYFAQEYCDYFQGSLEETWSGGSATLEWCMNYIKGHTEFWQDVIVISANPHISSIPLPHVEFDPGGKFKKVYDVWREEKWLDPETVCREYEELKPFPKDQKVVLWFIQPHRPYLMFQDQIPSHEHKDAILGGKYPKRRGWKKEVRKFSSGLENKLKYLPLWFLKLPWKLYQGIKSLLKLLWFLKLPWKLYQGIQRLFTPLYHKLFGLTGIRRFMVEKGEDKVQKAYRYNLRRVLEAIAKTNFGDRKTVITADHGEIISWKERKEYGFLGHPPNKDWGVLRKVPWFQIEKPKSQ